MRRIYELLLAPHGKLWRQIIERLSSLSLENKCTHVSIRNAHYLVQLLSNISYIINMYKIFFTYSSRGRDDWRHITAALLRNKRLLLKFLSWQNASKFTTYTKTQSCISIFHFMLLYFFPLVNALGLNNQFDLTSQISEE